jgi:general secretion pathway protein F
MPNERERPAVTAYTYRAARTDGRIVSGTLQSSQAAEAAAALVDRGLFPLTIEVELEREPGGRSAPRRELAIVFRSIASLVSAGVPLDKALVASEAVASVRLKALLTEATTKLRQGESLAGALQQATGLVPALAIGMIRAGERGGRMSRALEEVATQLELEAELMSRVRQALAYPMLLATVGTATVLVITTVVVPRFAELLEGAGQQLPPATRFLLSTSSLVQHHGWLIAAAIIGVLLLGIRWRRTAAGALRWDRGLLALPLLGAIRRALASARCCRALGGMLESGMPLLAALDAVGPALGDREVAARLGRARELVAQGVSLTQALDRSQVLNPAALQLVAVGESSGQLALMVERAGSLAAQHAERGIRNLVNLLEPALIVTFGALVAFVASALLQAVYGLRAM